MSSFGNQGAGFYAGTNWGNPYGGRYYSPSGQLTGNTGLKGGTSPLDAAAELAYASQSGGDTIGSYGGDGPSTGGGRSQGAGPAMGALTSMGVGYLGSQAGLPGYATGPLGSFAGKAVGKGEITEHDLATVSLATAAKAAAPALFANPAVALGLGVAGLFGFNPFSSLIDLFAREFSITDLMSDQARAGYVSDMLGVDMSDVGVGRGAVSTVTNSYDALNAPTRDAPEAPPGFDENDLGFGITASSRDFGPDMSKQGDDKADPSTTSGGWGAGLSDGMSGGFSDGQAGDPWKSGGLVQYSEWKKRRC